MFTSTHGVVSSSGGAVPFSPPELSNLKLWLKADTGITLNGGNVSQWDDQSGNGNHAVQATSTAQPLFVASAVNGQPALDFDGTSDYFSCGSTNLNIAEFLTLVIIFQLDNYQDRTVIGKGYNSNGGHHFGPNANGTMDNLYIDASKVSLSGNVAVGLSFMSMVQTCALGSGNIKLYKNGVLFSTGTTSQDLVGTNANNFLIGSEPVLGGRFHNGQIAEIFSYSTVLSDADRQLIEAYILTKYGF